MNYKKGVDILIYSLIILGMVMGIVKTYTAGRFHDKPLLGVMLIISFIATVYLAYKSIKCRVYR